MPLYRVDIAADRFTPFPPVESLPEVEAESPLEEIRQALRVVAALRETCL